MSKGSLQDALEAFMQNNPDLPSGEENAIQVEENNKSTYDPFKGVKLSVAIEKKGRAGKTATIIFGLSALEAHVVDDLAKELKKTLGTGGSWRGDEILIQGERRDDVVKFLKAKGFTVK